MFLSTLKRPGRRVPNPSSQKMVPSLVSNRRLASNRKLVINRTLVINRSQANLSSQKNSQSLLNLLNLLSHPSPLTLLPILSIRNQSIRAIQSPQLIVIHFHTEESRWIRTLRIS